MRQMKKVILERDLLGNYIEDHLKVLAYSTSRARTSGDGLEGDLITQLMN